MNQSLTGLTIDGRYEVLREISRGGMGVIYEVRHRFTGRREALKVISGDMAGDPGFRERFLVEARAVAALSNPHTVTLFDCGETSDGLLYLSMELLSGTSLKDLLPRQGPLEWRRAVELTIQASRSLEEAHAAGIVHRDIKPSNLFVMTRDDGRDLLKVLDFGIARFQNSEEDLHLTRPGNVVGTPLYMSPEQHLGLEVGRETDIYSLALVLFEMLTLRPPLDARSPGEIRGAYLFGSGPDLASGLGAASVPPGLGAVLRRASAREPSARYRTMGEFRLALETLLADPSLAASGSVGFEETLAGELPTHPVSIPLVPEVPPEAGIDPGPRIPRALLTRLGALALLVVVGLVLPNLYPARYLDNKALLLKQSVHLVGSDRHCGVIRAELAKDAPALLAAGLPVPGEQGPQTWRGVDALLLEKLARAGAAVVVFDKFYGRDYPDETRLLAGAVSAARDLGTLTVVGALHSPPPKALLEAGALAGTTLAEQSGFDGSVSQLMTSTSLLDGSTLPSVFLRAFCLYREARGGIRYRPEDLARCEERIAAEEPGLILRYSEEEIPNLRLTDVFTWRAEDLEEFVRGRVIFVGVFARDLDEVLAPPVPSLEPTGYGAVHGVMLLASAFNQLDLVGSWSRVPFWLALPGFLALSLLFWYFLTRLGLKRARVTLISVLFAGTLSILSLPAPVLFPWGGVSLTGLIAAALWSRIFPGTGRA